MVQCTHPADLGAAATLEALLPALPARIDALVNNAGGAPGSATDSSTLLGLERQLRATLQLNLFSAALLTEALAPRLARPGGRVVNWTSPGFVDIGVLVWSKLRKDVCDAEVSSAIPARVPS